MVELEQRVTELESRLAFQDDTIHALNSSIVSQQQQIDLLERKVQLLVKAHNELLEQWRETDDNIPPPHY